MCPVVYVASVLRVFLHRTGLSIHANANNISTRENPLCMHNMQAIEGLIVLI